MGGKPQKPKIQAYVDQRCFNEFEFYCQQHNLNQSKCLEQILNEFFGLNKQSASLEPPTYTAIAPNFTTALEELQQKFSNLGQQFSNLGQRLLVVENRLAVESVTESTFPLAESVVALGRLANESASKSASESATGSDGLANESALPPSESAVTPNRLAVESVLPLAESAMELNGLANESANESASESAVAPHRLASESAYESASVTEEIAPDSIPEEVKRGKRPAEETKKLIESRLAHGEIIDIKKLAEIASVTAEAVRQRTRDEKLGAWGIEPIPNTRPQAYRRTNAAH